MMFPFSDAAVLYLSLGEDGNGILSYRKIPLTGLRITQTLSVPAEGDRADHARAVLYLPERALPTDFLLVPPEDFSASSAENVYTLRPGDFFLPGKGSDAPDAPPSSAYRITEITECRAGLTRLHHRKVVGLR